MNYLMLLGDGVELSSPGYGKASEGKWRKVNFSSVEKVFTPWNMLHSNWILNFFIGWMGYELHRYVAIHLCCVFMLLQHSTYGGTYHINIKNSYTSTHSRSPDAPWMLTETRKFIWILPKLVLQKVGKQLHYTTTHIAIIRDWGG